MVGDDDVRARAPEGEQVLPHDGRLVDQPGAGGRAGVRHRISWTPNPDGSVRQHWETSTDGAAWTTAFDGRYLRAEAFDRQGLRERGAYDRRRARELALDPALQGLLGPVASAAPSSTSGLPWGPLEVVPRSSWSQLSPDRSNLDPMQQPTRVTIHVDPPVTYAQVTGRSRPCKPGHVEFTDAVVGATYTAEVCAIFAGDVEDCSATVTYTVADLIDEAHRQANVAPSEIVMTGGVIREVIADGGDLLFALTRRAQSRDPYPDATRPDFAVDAKARQGRDDPTFEAFDEGADIAAPAPQVEHRVNDALAGAVIGDLAASIDLHHGNITRRKQVFLRRVQTQGKDRRVFAVPDLVRRRVVPLIREFLH